MNDRLYKYLQSEWRHNNQQKYHKYFDVWVNNLTEIQIHYYNTLWLR